VSLDFHRGKETTKYTKHTKGKNPTLTPKLKNSPSNTQPCLIKGTQLALKRINMPSFTLQLLAAPKFMRTSKLPHSETNRASSGLEISVTQQTETPLLNCKSRQTCRET
jgi:hypothetical protein